MTQAPLVPMGDALFMRPKPLVWKQEGDTFLAHSALGGFTVSPVASTAQVQAQGLWFPALNYAPFPVLAPTREDAENLALLGQIVHQDLLAGQLEWGDEHGHRIAHGYDQAAKKIMWLVRPSEGTAGWYTLRDWQPSYVALADAEQAMAACAQYAAYVWLALGEVATPR